MQQQQQRVTLPSMVVPPPKPPRLHQQSKEWKAPTPSIIKPATTTTTTTSTSMPAESQQKQSRKKVLHFQSPLNTPTVTTSDLPILYNDVEHDPHVAGVNSVTTTRTTTTIAGNMSPEKLKQKTFTSRRSIKARKTSSPTPTPTESILVASRLAQGCSTLMHACQQGDVAAVLEQLRTQPERIRQRDSRNKSVLHYCAAQQKRELVAAASIAVAAPELLESADEDGFTPLHLAVIQGNLAMVNLLLANKADVNAVDKEGHSVVHWATVCGEVEALRAVLAAGANVTTPDINGGSPLHYAAQMCGANYEGKSGAAASSKLAMDTLAILLGHPQSSVDLQDKDGRQPILWAASAGSAKAVIALVKQGARVESADKDGLTALHCAASRGHTECIDTLISLCGAPTDLIDSNGCTALHYAVTLGHADATSRLLELEADPNRQDRKGRTPAHCGCSKGQFETVKLLKEHGANLWLRNAKGDLPVHEAASSGRRELVEWLLEQRPKQVNTTSNDGRSLMHIATVNDYTDMCKMLLDYGADVNAIYRNSKGAVITPLDCALQKAHRSTAKFMQANGGLPASKLRLAARRSNPFQEASGDVVRPLKYVEKEEVHDLRNSKKYVVYLKRSDSDGGEASCSCHEQTYHKEQRYSHVCRRHQRSRRFCRRRTSSCGDPKSVKQVQRGDSGSDICRSKSNIELRCRRSRERTASSSEDEMDEGEDSCENCCYHKREKRRVIKRRSTPNARRFRELKDSDGGSEKHTEERKPSSGGRKAKSEQQTNAAGTKPPCSSSVTSKPAASSRPSSAASGKRKTPPTSAAKDAASTKVSPQEAAESNDSVPMRVASIPEKESMTDDEDVEQKQSEVVHAVVHRGADDGQSTASLKLSDDAESHHEEKLGEASTLEINEVESSKQQDEGVSEVGEVIEGVAKEVDQVLETAAAVVADDDAPKAGDEAKKEEIVSEPLPTTEMSEEAKDDKNDDTEVLSISNNVEKTEATQKADDMSTLKTTGPPPKLIQTPATPRTATPPTPAATPTPVAAPEPTAASAPTPASISSAEATAEATADPTAELPTQPQDKESKPAEEKSEDPKSAEKGDEKVATAAPQDSPAPVDHSPVVPVLPTTASTYTTDPGSPAPVAAPTEATSKEANNQQREQETRRSFTLLPSDSADEEQPIRKSSFQVLNSDESLDLDAANAPVGVEDVEHDAECSTTPVFKIVSRGHSSQDEEEYEEDEPQDAAVVDDDKTYEDDSPLRRFSSSGNRHGVSNIAATEYDYASIRRRRLKKRIRSGTKSRSNWQSSIEEHVKTAPQPPQVSSKDQDSGFEPSPRATKSKIPTPRNIYTANIARRPIYATLDGRSCSSRVENRKPGDKGACDMTAVTRSIQRNIRRYYMERKIFQHLLELKSLQIRSNKLNEAVLVKRAVDDYHKSCAALGGETGGRMRRYPYSEYTFKNFELFLYETLKALQKPGTYNFQNINEVYEEAERRLSPDYNAYEKAMQCTSKTHRCLHAAHAYTGIPCAAYIPMMNHHTMPKFGFGPYKKTGVGSFYLPKILTGNSSCGGKVSLEFSHGRSKQLIPLPSEKLDSNKRYYVTFTVKESQSGEKQQPAEAAAQVYGERK